MNYWNNFSGSERQTGTGSASLLGLKRKRCMLIQVLEMLQPPLPNCSAPLNTERRRECAAPYRCPVPVSIQQSVPFGQGPYI